MLFTTALELAEWFKRRPRAKQGRTNYAQRLSSEMKKQDLAGSSQRSRWDARAHTQQLVYSVDAREQRKSIAISAPHCLTDWGRSMDRSDKACAVDEPGRSCQLALSSWGLLSPLHQPDKRRKSNLSSSPVAQAHRDGLSRGVLGSTGLLWAYRGGPCLADVDRQPIEASSWH